MTVTLIDMVAEVFPNAEPVWHGAPVLDSCVLPFGDVTFVVTPDDDGEGYLLGVYPGDTWITGHDDPSSTVLHRDPAGVLAMLDYLTEPPEGVDIGAWAAQRIADDGDEADRAR